MQSQEHVAQLTHAARSLASSQQYAIQPVTKPSSVNISGMSDTGIWQGTTKTPPAQRGEEILGTPVGTGGITTFINPGAGNLGLGVLKYPEAPDHGNGTQVTPDDRPKPIVDKDTEAADQPESGDEEEDANGLSHGAKENEEQAAEDSVNPLYRGSGWEHVLSEHVAGSPGVGPRNTLFIDDSDQIGNLIEEAVEEGDASPNTGVDRLTGRQRDGTVYTYDFGYTIGTTQRDNPVRLTKVQVVLNTNGSIRTAYPIR